MKKFLNTHYAFRVNLLRQSTEWRPLSADGQPVGPFRPLDEMTLNTIYFRMCEAMAHRADGKGIPRRHELQCYLFSHLIPQYHPIRDYMASLPRWDGRDRVKALAGRVSSDVLWHKVFSTWLRALAAQWMGVEMQAANSMVPVLVSERQGLMKSTFCRLLVPEVLQEYYLDKLDFTQAGEYDRMMAQFGLINLDELDRYSPAAMARFKSATQMKTIVGHSTRTTLITNAPRLASFIATTNQTRILRDRTGSRRFYCQRVASPISCRPVNHAQLFAQLKAEVERGERTWFTKQEEAAIQRHNQQYQALTPLQTAILQHFMPLTEEEMRNGVGEAPAASQSPSDLASLSPSSPAYLSPSGSTALSPSGSIAAPLPTVTAAEIFAAVSRTHPRLTAGVRLCDLARQLPAILPATTRRKAGYRYYAVALTPNHIQASSPNELK